MKITWGFFNKFLYFRKSKVSVMKYINSISISWYLKGSQLFQHVLACASEELKEILQNIIQILKLLFKAKGYRKKVWVETNELRTFDCLRILNILKFSRNWETFHRRMISWSDSFQRNWISSWIKWKLKNKVYIKLSWYI